MVFNIGLLIGVRNLLKQNELGLEDDLVGTINGVVQTITDANERMNSKTLEVHLNQMMRLVLYLELKGIVKELNDKFK